MIIVSITKIERKPHSIQSTGLKDGKRQFNRNPQNLRLQFLRCVWDCQHHTDEPVTFAPPHMERNCDRGSHHTYRTFSLIENTGLNQDQINTNCVEEFPYLLWCTKCLQRRPNHHNGENIDPGTSLLIYTQDTAPVDLVELWWPTSLEDQNTRTTCHIMVLSALL